MLWEQILINYVLSCSNYPNKYVILCSLAVNTFL